MQQEQDISASGSIVQPDGLDRNGIVLAAVEQGSMERGLRSICESDLRCNDDRFSGRSNARVPVAWRQGAIFPDECAALRRLYRELAGDSDVASWPIGEDPTRSLVPERFRKFYRESAELIGERFGGLIEYLSGFCYNFNDDIWKYEVFGSIRAGGLVIETQRPGTRRRWHTDVAITCESMGYFRKLVVVAQLAALEEYEGGTLQIFDGERVIDAPKEQGTIICFPTFLLHRVTPITRGARWVLLSSMVGPHFQ